MALPKKIVNLLEKHGINYEVVKHRTVYTAYDLAQTLREKLSSIAKTLLVKADSKYVLVVIPAHYKLDFQKLKKLLKAKQVNIAKEDVMKKMLKIKPGALTPFGKAHKIGVILDKTLVKAEHVILGAGSFTESLRMKMKDFLKLENPVTGSVGKKTDLKLTSKSESSTKARPKK